VDAANAANLNGQPASAYELSSHFVRSGFVTARAGATAILATFGSFALTLKCNTSPGPSPAAEIDATSSEADSEGAGTQMVTPGQSYPVLAGLATDGAFDARSGLPAEFFTPGGQAFAAVLTVGENYPGLTSAPCYGSALVMAS
jgi:hypothetical protein